MVLNLKTAAAEEPVTLDEMKLHLRVTEDEENELIWSTIAAARGYIERTTRQQLITATYELFLDKFPTTGAKIIRLPRPPLQSVTSIKYVDIDGATQTLASSKYDVDIHSEPSRVAESFNNFWPSTRNEVNAVTIEYLAGYGLATTVPPELKMAIKMLASHWFENRETVTIGVVSKEMALSVNTLIWNNKVEVFANA